MATGSRNALIFDVDGTLADTERAVNSEAVYLHMLDALQLPARQCLAFEDSANGLRAARAAGLATLITSNPLTAHHNFAGALRVVPDLSQVTLAQLIDWQNSAQV